MDKGLSSALLFALTPALLPLGGIGVRESGDEYRDYLRNRANLEQ
ncbi:MAG TPA: hypothetical protein VNK49_09875 [Anaerolineales bacterium]|nr:hypothetical protein [Anaerolineales bacterium]